jgi:hypothetical protein
MAHNKVDGREGGLKRTRLPRFLPAFFAVILLIPALGANAQVQNASGTATLGNSLQYGNTSYSVKCSYPPTAVVGSNLTITVTLHVNSLTGLVEYITNYGLVAQVFVGSQVLEGSALSTANATFLYPGSSWGPFNITIPLTANNTGLAKGDSANATLGITLRDSVFYSAPQLNVYVTEPAMQGVAGGLLIENPATSTSTSTTNSHIGQTDVLYAALVAAGAVLMLGAALWPRRPGRVSPGPSTQPAP